MTTPDADVRAALVTAVTGSRLLDHPFYRRWSLGEVGGDELAAYAAQYRHLEAALPAWLERIAETSPDPALASAARRNLADETGVPSHMELFEAFAAAAGAGHEDPSPATTRLLRLHDRLITGSPAVGLAAIAAYELQSPEVAASKAAGLREHHGLDGDAVAFWDVHAAVDGDHGDWSVAGLAASGADPAVVLDAAQQAAQGWWAFLDERESRPHGGGEQAPGRRDAGRRPGGEPAITRLARPPRAALR